MNGAGGFVGIVQLVMVLGFVDKEDTAIVSCTIWLLAYFSKASAQRRLHLPTSVLRQCYSLKGV